MPKPKGMEEYDGYEVPEPREYTPEEWEKVQKKISELRKKVKEANSKPSK